MQFTVILIHCFLASFTAYASGVPYEQYILAPSSRTLYPVSIYNVNGSVTGAESLTGDGIGSATFQDVSAVTFDYGKEIGGVVSLTVGDVDDGQYVGITFAESSLWISGIGSDGGSFSQFDAPLWFQPSEPGIYTVPREYERGGFRYLSLITNSTGKLEVTQVTTQFTPMPHYSEDALRNYTGFFHSNDELVNRIWYAGAYTNQLCTIDSAHGNSLPWLLIGNDDEISAYWFSNTTISNGTSVLVDGARRDRLIWAGDMSIAVPGIVVSTNDLISVRNSLDSLFALQNRTTGQLPYAGVGFFPDSYSETYHLYTLIGVANYYLYVDDLEYLLNIWSQWKRAMDYSISQIDDSGLMNVTLSADWLRFGMGAHNIEANSILYHTLQQGLVLSRALNDSSTTDLYASVAETIKNSANALLWNETAGFYNDNETSTLHPQDGNSWAVVANLTDSPEKIARISANLQERWGPYGAPAPEAGTAVSPFIGGFELQTHFAAGNATRALELMRLQWGYMLDGPHMTNSTFIEGYEFSGALHYAPYPNDVRISHAHGWSTGPTSTLTFNVAGIVLESAGGASWLMKPQLGDLELVHAGFSTGLGLFENRYERQDNGSFKMVFQAPRGTKGKVSLENQSCAGTIVLTNLDGTGGNTFIHVRGDDENARIELADIVGGRWELNFTCSGLVTEERQKFRAA